MVAAIDAGRATAPLKITNHGVWHRLPPSWICAADVRRSVSSADDANRGM